MGTGQRLYLAFAIPRRPNIDELALLAGFDQEAEIRKAISVVLEIDMIMDLNADNLRQDPLDRYWPYQCCGSVCICVHHPGDDRADGALPIIPWKLCRLELSWGLVYLSFKGHECRLSSSLVVVWRSLSQCAGIGEFEMLWAPERDDIAEYGSPHSLTCFDIIRSFLHVFFYSSSSRLAQQYPQMGGEKSPPTSSPTEDPPFSLRPFFPSSHLRRRFSGNRERENNNPLPVFDVMAAFFSFVSFCLSFFHWQQFITKSRGDVFFLPSFYLILE